MDNKNITNKITNTDFDEDIITAESTDLRQCRNYDISTIGGASEEFIVTITDDMLDSFEKATGDHNPLHTDPSFAKDRGYKDKVAFGLLTADFLSTLCGMYLPGERSLIQEMRIKFPKPVYVGDVLTVKGVVDEVHEAVRQVVLKISMSNQDGEKVLRGSIRVGLLDG